MFFRILAIAFGIAWVSSAAKAEDHPPPRALGLWEITTQLGVIKSSGSNKLPPPETSKYCVKRIDPVHDNSGLMTTNCWGGTPQTRTGDTYTSELTCRDPSTFETFTLRSIYRAPSPTRYSSEAYSIRNGVSSLLEQNRSRSRAGAYPSPSRPVTALMKAPHMHQVGQDLLDVTQQLPRQPCVPQRALPLGLKPLPFLCRVPCPPAAKAEQSTPRGRHSPKARLDLFRSLERPALPLPQPHRLPLAVLGAGVSPRLVLRHDVGVAAKPGAPVDAPVVHPPRLARQAFLAPLPLPSRLTLSPALRCCAPLRCVQPGPREANCRLHTSVSPTGRGSGLT
eukprot:gene17100-17291_t